MPSGSFLPRSTSSTSSCHDPTCPQHPHSLPSWQSGRDWHTGQSPPRDFHSGEREAHYKSVCGASALRRDREALGGRCRKEVTSEGEQACGTGRRGGAGGHTGAKDKRLSSWVMALRDCCSGRGLLLLFWASGEQRGCCGASVSLQSRLRSQVFESLPSAQSGTILQGRYGRKPVVGPRSPLGHGHGQSRIAAVSG